MQIKILNVVVFISHALIHSEKVLSATRCKSYKFMLCFFFLASPRKIITYKKMIIIITIQKWNKIMWAGNPQQLGQLQLGPYRLKITSKSVNIKNNMK